MWGTHHSGMLSSSMRSLLYGMPFSSSVSIVLWENGPASTRHKTLSVRKIWNDSSMHVLVLAVQSVQAASASTSDHSCSRQALSQPVNIKDRERVLQSPSSPFSGDPLTYLHRIVSSVPGTSK